MQHVLERMRDMDPSSRARMLAQLAERGEEFNVYPVSSGQRRLWLLDQMRPGGGVYNVPYAFRLSGHCDIEALDRALRTVGQRHEALRTVFLPIAGEPRQAVLPEPQCSLVVEECDAVGAAGRDAFVRARAAEDARAPFDLATGPLLRARLLRLGPADAALLLCMHHIICDGWSIRVLFDELEAAYAAWSEGNEPRLGPAPFQYVDYALWQRDWLANEVSDELRRYWTEQLAGAPPVLELPIDRPRPAVQSLEGGLETFTWPAWLAERLDAFCRAEGVTPFMVIMAAYNALLYRYCGQEDIVVGTGVANRSRVEWERVVGFFVNTLALRTHVDPGASFRALLRQVRDTSLAAHAHQNLPFDAVVDAQRVERVTSHHPLFQTLFVLQDSEAEQLRLPSLAVSRLPSHSGTSKFDLLLAVTSTEGGISGWLEHDRALFEPETARRLLGHLRELLVGALDDPACSVERLPLLSQAERTELVRDWSRQAQVEPSRHTKLTHELLEERADATPAAVAVVCGEDQLTYRQLEERANQLAHHLRALGVVPETLVGISLPRSVDLVVAMMGVLKSGGAYLPLDPEYPTKRLVDMVEDAGARIVVTNSALTGWLPASVRAVCLDAEQSALAACHSGRAARTATPDNLAYVIYTSGSTGQPKGAMIPHRGVVNLAEEQVRVFGVTTADRVLQFASFSFDASVLEIMLGLHGGGTVVMAPRHQLQPGPDLVRLIRGQGVTITFLPPTVLRLMDPDDVPGLRTLVVGGEPCPEEFAAAWAPGRVFINIYGPTEGSIWSTFARCSGRERPLPIGRPIRDVEVYVLDRNLEPVPMGVPGELCLGGVGVSRGYLRRPELTAEQFVPDPFSGWPGARLYRSGDLVRFRPDARLEFLGRLDGQVKVRGYRIELGEIQALLSAQPAVRAAVVVTREDIPGDVRLVAYVVARDGQRVEPSALRAALRSRLPEHMIPAAFVAVDAIPRTTNGKLDRRALPAPDTQPADGAGARAEPATELERTISEVWREVLQVKGMGVDENFFDLGGNSLLIAKVRTYLEERLGREVPTLALFTYPTIHALATHLGGDGAEREQPSQALADRGDRVSAGRRLLAERSARRQATQGR